MKRRAPWILVPVALAAILQVATAKDATKSPSPLAELGWLAGSWSGSIGPKQWEACYTTPAGGEILSVNKEMRDGKLVMIEFERFRMVDGRVTVTPYPFGKEADVSFTLVKLDVPGRRAEFANPAHDFPQRLIYHRVADDRLKIDVIGEQRGAPVALQVDLKRLSHAAP